ncbi:MAG TPA: serine hydrolase domain-containing protein [Xanthobacteraceae bacterium]
MTAGIITAGMTGMPLMAQAADPLPRATPEDVGMSSERLALIGKAVNSEIAHDQLPGAVLAIARRGKLVYFETFGYRDKAAGAPMTSDAIFNIASMTKPMVAVGALQLYEQGKLLMDEPVAKYFPKFANMQVAVMDAKKENIVETVLAARKITIQDLFRHTSGLIYGGRGTTAVHKLYPEGSSQAAAAMTGAEFVDHLSSRPLLYQPGTVWDYGFGLDVLGLVIEQVTEQSLGSYLQQNVWKPLGMADTTFLIPPEKAARYAKALPSDPTTGNPQSMTPLTQKTKFECGGGCAASTANDYLRFALMLMNKGKYGDARVLGPKTVEYMLSNQLAPDVKNLIVNGDPTRADYGFGLGLAVRTTPGIVRMMGSVGDFSWPGASGTNWWADPHEQLAVVWMAQSPGPIRWKYRQMINALVYQAIVD